MDNTQQSQNSLAGDIITKVPDPFAETTTTSNETKLLVEKIEEKESGITPVAKTAPVVKGKETFLDRLLANAGIKGGKPSAPVPNLPPKMPATNTPPVQKVTRDFSKFTRGFLVTLIVLAIISGLYLLLYFTNIDTQFIKITLTGTVTNAADNKPLAGTELFIDNTSVGKTDSIGRYSIQLDKLKFNLKATLKDYSDYVEDISVPRTILSYTFTKNIVLTSTKIAKVVGKFVADDKTYKFTDDKLFFNDEEFVLNEDGTFDLSQVPTGTVKMTFESVNLKDIVQDVTLNPGNNTIKEIRVTPAGDAVGSVISYVREDLVPKTKFTIENVQDNQISINDQGKFRIKDLDIARTYKIRSSADGYLTRDYEVTIKQGDNEVFGFKMVEAGIATYLGADSLRVNHFFKSDFDGENPEQIETISKSNPKSEYYDSRDSLLYFLSQHEQIKGQNRTVDIAYSLNPETKELKRLTTSNIQNLDAITVNFRAKKLSNNYLTGPSNQKQRMLQVMDLAGENAKTLRTETEANNFDNILFSGDGKYVYFREGDLSSKAVELPIIYKVDTLTGDSVKVGQRKISQLHAVSEDGNLLVYSALNETTNLRDLYLFNSSTNETRTIKENHDGSQYQFLNQNNDQIIFFAKRDGKNDIYDYSISQNSTTRITNLAIDDVITSVYQQDKYAFYITKRGLYVIDILKPQSFKLVTNKITKYTN